MLPTGRFSYLSLVVGEPWSCHCVPSCLAEPLGRATVLSGQGFDFPPCQRERDGPASLIPCHGGEAHLLQRVLPPRSLAAPGWRVCRGEGVGTVGEGVCVAGDQRKAHERELSSNLWLKQQNSRNPEVKFWCLKIVSPCGGKLYYTGSGCGD